MALASVALGFGQSCLAAEATGSTPDRAATEAIIRDYLLANPEIVLKAQQRARDKSLRKAIEVNRQALQAPYPGAAIGPDDAAVTIVEFMDYG